MTLIYLVPMDLLLVFMAAMTGIGMSWAAAFGAWLWAHATIVGIVLLVLHILLSLGSIAVTAEVFGILGGISAGIRSLLPPAIVVLAYRAILAAGLPFGVELLVQWTLVFLSMVIAEFIWYKGSDEKSGFLKFVVFTVVSIAVNAFTIYLILQQGIGLPAA